MHCKDVEMFSGKTQCSDIKVDVSGLKIGARHSEGSQMRYDQKCFCLKFANARIMRYREVLTFLLLFIIYEVF